jgi:hypothetical protein
VVDANASVSESGMKKSRPIGRDFPFG